MTWDRGLVQLQADAVAEQEGRRVFLGRVGRVVLRHMTQPHRLSSRSGADYFSGYDPLLLLLLLLPHSSELARHTDALLEPRIYRRRPRRAALPLSQRLVYTISLPPTTIAVSFPASYDYAERVPPLTPDSYLAHTSTHGRGTCPPPPPARLAAVMRGAAAVRRPGRQGAAGPLLFSQVTGSSTSDAKHAGAFGAGEPVLHFDVRPQARQAGGGGVGGSARRRALLASAEQAAGARGWRELTTDGEGSLMVMIAITDDEGSFMSKDSLMTMAHRLTDDEGSLMTRAH